jgi:hypothetical protein
MRRRPAGVKVISATLVTGLVGNTEASFTT